VACSRNYDELEPTDGYDQLRNITVDLLMMNQSVHRRLRKRRERADRAVECLKACRKIDQADWFGSVTDMAAVAMILQRDVAVADEYVKGGHATVSTSGFTIVAPARKVTTIIGYDAARPEGSSIGAHGNERRHAGHPTLCDSLACE
jgi:hypothetical protein